MSTRPRDSASATLAPSSNTHAAPPARSRREQRPKHLRLDLLKRESAAVARTARLSSGKPQRQLALELDVTASFVARCEIPSEPHAYSILHLASGPSDEMVPQLEWALGKHGRGVRELPRVLELSEAARHLQMLTDCTEVPRATAERIADGVDEVHEVELELSKTRRLLATTTQHEAHLIAKLARLRGAR